MHEYLVYAYKSQDFAQCQKNFARSHDRETVTFRNSDKLLYIFNTLSLPVIATFHTLLDVHHCLLKETIYFQISSGNQ